MKIKPFAFDPSYTIRSVPANAADSIYCTLLSQNAVHGAMAGFTGFSVGLANNRVVYLPIPAITANSPRRLNPRGRTYERLLAITQQPDPLAFPEAYASRKGGAPAGKD
jgi:6-phosphofructokinase 1